MYKTDRKKTVVLLFAFILTAIFSITTVHASKSEAPRYTIQITLNDAVAIGILDNTPTTRDFVAQLPLTVKLDDYSATEKITYLPNKLTTQSTPSGITPISVILPTTRPGAISPFFTKTLAIRMG